MLHSPIEYYGGKSYMTEIIQDYFPDTYKLYVEGFGGGASLLLNKQRDDLEIYNDLNKNLYSLFKVISDGEQLELLKQKLELTYVSADIRKDFIYKLKNENDLSELDRAYYYLYVNRTSYNGVGGFVFNPLVRRGMSKKVSDYLSCIDKLPEIHERLRECYIENRDIFELLDKYDAEDTFFYLDPPYVQSTRKSNQKYDLDMTDDMHKQFIKRLSTIKGKVLLSGYDNPIYDTLVNDYGWNKFIFQSPNAKSDAAEVLWYNYDNIRKNTYKNTLF